MLFTKTRKTAVIVTLVRILGTFGIEYFRKVADSKVDMNMLPKNKDGTPVFGNYQYRQMTLAEIKAASGSSNPRKVLTDFPIDCLVPLTSNPVYVPRGLKSLVNNEAPPAPVEVTAPLAAAA